MFGSDAHLEKKLRKGGGKRGKAIVISVEQGGGAWQAGGPANRGPGEQNYKLTVQLTPEDGEPGFETEIQKRDVPPGPEVGWSFHVLYDPDDRAKVAIDHEWFKN